MKRVLPLALITLASVPSQASAYDWSGGAKVVLIEATYAPGTLPFQVDHAMGNCPAGTMLTWVPQGADAATKAQNYQAILAALMTAKSTGQQVVLAGDNAGCNVSVLWLE